MHDPGFLKSTAFTLKSVPLIERGSRELRVEIDREPRRNIIQYSANQFATNSVISFARQHSKAFQLDPIGSFSPSRRTHRLIVQLGYKMMRSFFELVVLQFMRDLLFHHKNLLADLIDRVEVASTYNFLHNQGHKNKCSIPSDVNRR